MAHIQLVKQTSSGLLLPATPESCDFLHQIKIGEWIHADFKRVRNYAFHKRFFKLLQLGFDYWTPSGGVITPRERELVSGFVEYLCESVGREHTPALSEAAEQYLNTVATRRTRDTALLKSFDAFREWVTIQAGFYTEHFYPDGSRGRRAKSIAFANMDETEFQQVYKSVLNVLWNWILFRKFSSPEEVENVAAQLSSLQERRLRLPVRRILDIMHRSELGKPLPDDFTFEFNPLWQMSDVDRSTVALNTTNAISTALGDGLMTLKAAMTDLRENSDVTGIGASITDEDIENAEDEAPPGIGESDDEPQEPSGGNPLSNQPTQDSAGGRRHRKWSLRWFK
ncbi:TPA: DUF1367 family protein [Escherichia coli]|nr:DUF1367 family protein [Escherichia coli]